MIWVVLGLTLITWGWVLSPIGGRPAEKQRRRK